MRGGALDLAADARVLITGGAGFIGSHLANALVRSGTHVRIFDALHAQVHGDAPAFPAHLEPGIDVCIGDIRDADAVRRALEGVTHVVHFAAAVGVGQSMYQIARYTDVNTHGTAVLLEQLAERQAAQGNARPVARLLVASSMSVYGEGLYRRQGLPYEPELRSRKQLSEGCWELVDQGEQLEPVPTPETKRVIPASVYALSKYDQEQLCLIVGEAYDIPTIALRFFNVYGPEQALSNPYTGVLAIFAARCLNGNPPLIFEDGEQRRDFVSVRDVVQGCRLALASTHSGEIFNIGSGISRTVREIAADVVAALGARAQPIVTGKYRVGDVRHCFADIAKARRLLGYEPRVAFADGLRELVQWLSRRHADDRCDQAGEELARRGLTL